MSCMHLEKVGGRISEKRMHCLPNENYSVQNKNIFIKFNIFHFCQTTPEGDSGKFWLIIMNEHL